MSRARLGRDFNLLWSAQGLSAFGSEISAVAIPLFAITTLGFGADKVGLLLAIEGTPPVLFGLFAGVWVDRLSRKTILLASDILRFALVLAMPLFYWSGQLTAPVLFICAFLVASITVFFDVAYWSYLPSLVAKEQLAHGNSRLSMTQSMATTGGPGMAGAITSFIGAPAALLLDALSYLASFVLLSRVRSTEPVAANQPAPLPVLSSLIEGLRFVIGNRFLVMLALGAAVWHLVYFSTLTNFYLYLARDLAAPAYVVGVLLSCGGAGSLAGALWVPRLREKLGSLGLLIGTLVGAQIALLAIPMLSAHALAQEIQLGVALFFAGAAATAHSILHITLRQEATPPELMGRMTSIIRLITWGAIPVGSIVGGWLGQMLPRVSAFRAISVTGFCLTAAWCAFLIMSVSGSERGAMPLPNKEGQPG